MNGKLRQFLKTCKRDVAIQLFDENWNTKVFPYTHKEVTRGYVSKDLLGLDVMDVIEEDDCTEIWVK